MSHSVPGRQRPASAYRFTNQLTRFCLVWLVLFMPGWALGQNQPSPTSPTSLTNMPQKDTTKTNTSSWHDEQTRIYFTKAYGLKKYIPDSSIHTFHRRFFSQPWMVNTGNQGSPARSAFFELPGTIGLSSGYHTFDVYRFDADSVLYYNTTRPYSSFTYQLGSKLEQVAQILHTQNIKPNWNIAAEYRKVTSPGYYKIQRTNHDNVRATTHYSSPDQRYDLYMAFVYNKEQNDENGGITADSFLTDPFYSDRKTINVRFENDNYSTLRSSVTNMQRDYSLLLNHGYTWGRKDTLYNADSSKYWTQLVPRFRITHRFQLQSEKHEFKDLSPDSLRYADFFAAQFPAGDSVFVRQRWTFADNRFMLNGIFGRKDKPLLFAAGIGNRLDWFNTYYATGNLTTDAIGNYLIGELKKEALQPGEWYYQANAQFIFTGPAAGNFSLDASLGKDLGEKWGSLTIGAQQQLRNAPYSYTIYQTAFGGISNSFDKESVTRIYGTVASQRLGLWGGIRNYLLTNYIYINQQQLPAQYAPAFNMLQAWLRKRFRMGIVVLDNELAFQQVSGNAPVHAPALLGRHQLAIETAVFKNRLQIATGIEVRYHTDYKADGYAPLLNRYFYQDSYQSSNMPEGSVFFNFRVKKFRSYIMVDQVQQLFGRNTIITPGYPAQNFMIRFGFNWVLIN